MKMSTVVARAIGRKMTRGGFIVSDVRNKAKPNSTDGTISEVIIAAKNGMRFRVSVCQIEEGSS
jgi:hypothetical protein